MHTSIYTSETHLLIERTHNDMKDKYTDTVYHANSYIRANIHKNTDIHHMYISTLAHESKRTENNLMRSYTIAQPDSHTDACLHAITRTQSIKYIHTYTQA